jgi:hypothetical protein
MASGNDFAEREPLTDPATGKPLMPREEPGYYPGFSTLKQKNYWDAATRRVVEKRVAGSHDGEKQIRFFNAEEMATMLAVVDRILPQDALRFCRRSMSGCMRTGWMDFASKICRRTRKRIGWGRGHWSRWRGRCMAGPSMS